MKKKSIKVLHLPTTVGGNPQGLSKHLQQIGVHSETWTLQQNYLGYPADKVIFKEGDSLIWCEIKRLWALSYVFRFDLVFFNFGRTLFRPIAVVPRPGRSFFKTLLHRIYAFYANKMQCLELFLLRALKRSTFIQYQGDDCRQGDYCHTHFRITAATQVEPSYYSAESDSLKRNQVALLAKNCCKIYALNPDLLHVLPTTAEFLPYSHISFYEWTPYYNLFEKRPLRVGHAPSHRGVKGTDLILNAIENLKKRDFIFDLIFIEGLSNAEAKERYKLIDILIDQLFLGWYGGVAVEAMALGKPVLVYIRDEDLKFLPPEMQSDLPVIRTTPDSIEQTLQYVLEMPREELFALAQKSRAYVERWHDPIAIAQRIKADIEQAIGSE